MAVTSQTTKPKTGTMQVTIEIPDSIGKNIPNMSEFASKAVLDAWRQEQMKQAEQQKTQPSKWLDMVEKIENDTDFDNPEFQEAWKKMKTDMKEFREGFEFKHDNE